MTLAELIVYCFLGFWTGAVLGIIAINKENKK